MAVAMRSSRLMSSISKALRIWVQPSRSSATTLAWSRCGRTRVLIASGAVVTWLSASAVAKILTRSMSMGTGIRWGCGTRSATEHQRRGRPGVPDEFRVGSGARGLAGRVGVAAIRRRRCDDAELSAAGEAGVRSTGTRSARHRGRRPKKRAARERPPKLRQLHLRTSPLTDNPSRTRMAQTVVAQIGAAARVIGFEALHAIGHRIAPAGSA